MEPSTYLIGYTTVDRDELGDYLRDTGQLSFYDQFCSAVESGLHPGFVLCSFYAKLCYRSLVLGKNANVHKVREIEDNLKGCIDQMHGAVFEHCYLNWVTTRCSRVFTHELVRHRAGFAFSQTSGRYCTPEDAELILPPDVPNELTMDANTLLENAKIFNEKWRGRLDLDNKSMSERKKQTSMLRRVMPVGCDNEIGWSCNIRSVRHVIEMRTSRHAEWEIRKVFSEVARKVSLKFPLLLYGGTVADVDGLPEWKGLRI